MNEKVREMQFLTIAFELETMISSAGYTVVFNICSSLFLIRDSWSLKIHATFGMSMKSDLK